MTFKNAVKLLLNHYPLIWKILLYLLMLVVLIASLSVSFAIPVFKTLEGSSVWSMLEDAVKSFLNGGGFGVFFEDIKALVAYATEQFRTDPILRRNSTVWLIVVMTGAYRFFLGLYELPLIHSLEGGMTDNARHGFTSGYIKLFGKSCCFALVKMLVMVLYDIMVAVITFYAVKLMTRLSLQWLAPFFAMVLLLALYALRFSLISGWAPAIVSGRRSVLGGLLYSVKSAFKSFASLYTLFLVYWTLVVTLCLIVGLFTLGAGLLLLVPAAMLFLNLLNLTFYYHRENKRYHLDGQIFDPQTQSFCKLNEMKSGESPANGVPAERAESGQTDAPHKDEPPDER